MKFQHNNQPCLAMRTPQPPMRRLRRAAGFTMVEIALSLAIIGFALVAIIGILPAGLSVQKDNREQTMINYDASLIMDLLRNGTRGPDTLTNYVIAITNVSWLCDTRGNIIGGPVTNWYRTNQTFLNGTLLPYSVLTRGSNIVGLLGPPRYIATNGNTAFWSNNVTADFRAFSGPATDLGQSQSARDFAFTYRAAVEILPMANFAYAISNTDWVNFTAPSPGLATIPDFSGHGTERHNAETLQQNLTQIRLRFNWPILPGGRTGGGRMVLRSAGSGLVRTNDVSFITPGLTFYYIRPRNFAAAD
jgi:type II secretory pathway pseudopilin PulG